MQKLYAVKYIVDSLAYDIWVVQNKYELNNRYNTKLQFFLFANGMMEAKTW